YARAIRQGIPLPRQWTGYSQHARECLPLPTKHLTAREVLAFRDAAFLTCYANKRYLEMIERRFGPETLAHIKQMTSHRLERDLLSGRMKASSVMLPREELGVRHDLLGALTTRGES